jgi:AcrR family transcriptional regulator
MAGSVKRTYSSEKRQFQAQATRRAILDAARSLFIGTGYAATTIQSIADHAAVAVQTVYAVFGNKRRILDELIEQSIVGDDASGGGVLETDAAAAITREPDPRRRAEMDAAVARAITERVAPIVRVAREAAASDPELAEVFEEMKRRRRAEMTAATKVLAGPVGRLRLPTAQAAATLYVLYSPDVADMLMRDYGWSGDKYEKWLAEMLYRTLLSDD